MESVAVPLEGLGRFGHGTYRHLLGRFGYGAVVVFATLLPKNSLSQVSLGDIEPGYHGGPKIETGTSTTWNFWLLSLRRFYVFFFFLLRHGTSVASDLVVFAL